MAVTEGSSVRNSHEMPSRTCIFCGGRPVTREHVFGDWLRRLAGLDEPALASQAMHRPGSVPEVIEFSAPPLARTARVVCASCNNGWMSAIETRAANVLTPMLQGRAKQLTGDDCASLARWAFKTSYVVDAAGLGSSSQFPSRERHEFRRRAGEPLEDSAVWLTSWPGTTTAWTQHWGVAASETAQTPSDGVNTYGATIAIGPLAFRTYRSDRPTLHPHYFQETRPGIFRIWPTATGLDWQPRFWLNAKELEDFAFGIPRALEQRFGTEPGRRFWDGEGESGPIRGPR